MARNDLVVRILGDVKDLSRKLGTASKDVTDFASRTRTASQKALSGLTSSLTSRFGAFGDEAQEALDDLAAKATGAGTAMAVGAAAGAAVAGAAITKFVGSGVDQWMQLVEQVKEFQRISGATAEDSSRLLDVADFVGVSADEAANGVFKLSQSLQKNRAVLAEHGIQVARNADGTTDLIGTLLNVADAYNRTEDPAKRNKLVMDAFGRSGAALIPILARGRDELERMFAATSDDEIITEEEKKRAEEYRVALHNLDEAVGNLQMALGEGAVPALTDFAGALTSAIEAARGAAEHVGGFGNIVQGMVNAIPGAGIVTAVTGFFDDSGDAAEDAAPEIDNYNEAIENTGHAAWDAVPALDAYSDAMDANLGASLKLSDASSDFAEVQERVRDELDGTGKSVRSSTADIVTYQEALDDSLGSVLDVDLAHESAADAVRGLAEALGQAGVGSENSADFMDRFYGRAGDAAADAGKSVREATADAVRAAEDEVDAMAESGEIADTAAARKQALLDKLYDLKEQFPAVAGQIDRYIGRVSAVSDKLPTAERRTRDMADANRDLEGSARDLVEAANDQVEAIKFTGTEAEIARQKHFNLLAVINDLKTRFPELAGIIDTYVADINRAWIEYLRVADPYFRRDEAIARNQQGLPGMTRDPQESGLTVNNYISGDGLDADAVAELTTRKTSRALVGARVG